MHVKRFVLVWSKELAIIQALSIFDFLLFLVYIARMISYDINNVFAKILRSEIPCKKFYEDNNVLCFEDRAKDAPVHLLVVPKQNYTCYEDFVTNADASYIVNFFKTIAIIAKSAGVSEEGYRLVTNNGSSAGQTVFHFHVHILAGKKMSER